MKNRMRTLAKAYAMLRYDVCWNVTNKSGNITGFFIPDKLQDSSRVIAEILSPIEETLEISCKELQDYFLADYAGEIILGDVILKETGELLLGTCTNECPDGFMSDMLENYLRG